jgi:hypothetical protein
MAGPVYRYFTHMLIIPFDSCAAGDVRKRLKCREKTNIVLMRFSQQCRPANQALTVQVSHPATLLKKLGKLGKCHCEGIWECRSIALSILKLRWVFSFTLWPPYPCYSTGDWAGPAVSLALCRRGASLPCARNGTLPLWLSIQLPHHCTD